MKISPTPWSLHGHEMRDKNGNILHYWGSDRQSLVDAGFIVKAVNAYARAKAVKLNKQFKSKRYEKK